MQPEQVRAELRFKLGLFVFLLVLEKQQTALLWVAIKMIKQMMPSQLDWTAWYWSLLFMLICPLRANLLIRGGSSYIVHILSDHKILWFWKPSFVPGSKKYLKLNIWNFPFPLPSTTCSRWPPLPELPSPARLSLLKKNSSSFLPLPSVKGMIKDPLLFGGLSLILQSLYHTKGPVVVVVVVNWTGMHSQLWAYTLQQSSFTQ